MAVEGRSVVVVLVGVVGNVVAAPGFAGSPRDEPGLAAEAVEGAEVTVATLVQLVDRVVLGIRLVLDDRKNDRALLSRRVCFSSMTGAVANFLLPSRLGGGRDASYFVARKVSSPGSLTV